MCGRGKGESPPASRMPRTTALAHVENQSSAAGMRKSATALPQLSTKAGVWKTAASLYHTTQPGRGHTARTASATSVRFDGARQFYSQPVDPDEAFANFGIGGDT